MNQLKVQHGDQKRLAEKLGTTRRVLQKRGGVRWWHGLSADAQAVMLADMRRQSAIRQKEGGAVMEWIKCSERMPEEEQVVWVMGYDYDDASKGWWQYPELAKHVMGEFMQREREDDPFANETQWSEYVYYARVWMPLPAPPEAIA